MRLERPEWILFDATDTLLRPSPHVAIAYSQVAVAHGIQVEPEQVARKFGIAIRRYFRDERSSELLDRSRWQQLVFDVLGTKKDVVFEELWEHFAQPASWELFHDVATSFDAIRSANIPLAIASNFDARLLNIIKTKPRLAGIQRTFLSSQIGFRKPSQRFFATIQQELGCDPQKLLMVGDDRTNDFDAALQAGWQAVHLDRSRESSDFPVLSSLTFLANLIEGLPKSKDV